MSVVTDKFTVTPAQWTALVAKVQQQFSGQVWINGNTVSAGPVEKVTLEAAYDGERNLVISLDGPWIEDEFGMGKIKTLVESVQ